MIAVSTAVVRDFVLGRADGSNSVAMILYSSEWSWNVGLGVDRWLPLPHDFFVIYPALRQCRVGGSDDHNVTCSVRNAYVRLR